MDTNAAFLIEDIFDIKGRGLVLTGRVLSGVIRNGLKGNINGKEFEISAIEAFRKTLDEAVSGETVGLMVKGNLQKADFENNLKQKMPITF